MPAEALPLEVYRDLVADARAAGARTLVDLSSPRLDSALAGEPDLVKINDWELAAFVRGPVTDPADLLAAARRVQDAGARRVIVTRGELPALVLDGEQALELAPPRFERGFREGCGDAMLGAMAAVWATHDDLPRALVQGAAAGAANFLRRGIGRASREVVDELSGKVALGPWPVEGGGAHPPTAGGVTGPPERTAAGPSTTLHEATAPELSSRSRSAPGPSFSGRPPCEE